MTLPKRFQKIYIEISNICNLACSFCPEVERDKKVMDASLFERVITQAASLTQEVTFHLMGEPLLHQNFGDYVLLCADQKVPVNITTNGSLIRLERATYLVHPIVRQVNFSLHSYFANPQSVTLTDYLKPIFDWTTQVFKDRPDLYINYRLWNIENKSTQPEQNEPLMTEIEKYFKVTIPRTVDVGFNKSKRLINRLYLHYDSRFEWPSLSGPQQGNSGFCHGLKSHIGIHADGTVVPCCLDKEAVISLGNCQDQELTDIVTSPRAIKIIEGFNKKQRVEPLCQHCQYINRFE
jgi:radical SAM protein with 4Fe4S-binding SPASM domain